MTYQLIIFDWDGTLYDSAAHIVNCVQSAAQKIGVEPPDPDQIKQMIGLSPDQSLKRLMPQLSPMDSARLIEQYQHCLINPPNMKPELFEGVEEVLSTLTEEGYWLAIATSKGFKGLQSDLNTLNIGHFFLTKRCADQTQSKPHPQMAQEILEELGVRSSDAILVGDTEYDMLLAHNARIDAIAATYGVHNLRHLAQPTIQGYLKDIRELPALLNHLKKCC